MELRFWGVSAFRKAHRYCHKAEARTKFAQSVVEANCYKRQQSADINGQLLTTCTLSDMVRQSRSQVVAGSIPVSPTGRKSL